MGKRRFWRHAYAHTLDALSDRRCLHQIRRRALVPPLIPTSSARLVSFCQPPPCVAFFDAASERNHCLAGLANQAERPSSRLRLSRLPLSIPTEGRKGRRGKREKVSFMNKEMSLFPCQTEFLHQVSEKSNGANSHMQIVVLISASDCFWSSLSSEAKMIDGTFTSNVQSEFIFRFH